MTVDIKKWLKENLSSERFDHVIGAEQTAKELAIRFNANPEKAALAGLTHDCAKCMQTENLLKIIRDNIIPVTNMELKSFKTLHAPVGAFIAQKELGIEDLQILDAIRYHTIGRVNMTLLDKIVFLADKIEPNTRSEEFRNKVLNSLDSTNNVDEGILICYDATIRRLLERNLVINPETINVYNDILLSLKN